MLYTYGLTLAAKLFLRAQFARALRYAVYPVNYWRNAEFSAALEALDVKAGERVLDVGSPKLLSLYLASRRGAYVEATDLHDYFIADYVRLRDAERLPEERYRMRAADGRRLPFADASFDHVYAISVVEHVPDLGDAECMYEMARVLKRGGRCFVTVPFAPEARDEYRAPDFYWAEEEKNSEAPPSSSSARTPEPVFYQRRYDEVALHARLIAPSRLRLKSLAYIGEQIFTGATQRQLSDYLPPWTGPLHPLFAAAFLTPPTADWKSLKKPLCAVIVLQKD